MILVSQICLQNLEKKSHFVCFGMGTLVHLHDVCVGCQLRLCSLQVAKLLYTKAGPYAGSPDLCSTQVSNPSRLTDSWGPESGKVLSCEFNLEELFVTFLGHSYRLLKF